MDYWIEIYKNGKIRDFTKWILSDKYVAKQFAQKYNLNTPKTYQLVEYPYQIDFSKLPNNYVIKPVDLCCSVGVFVMKNNINILDNKEYHKNDIIKKLNYLRAQNNDNFYMYDNMYSSLPPFTGYIVEELLLDNDQLPDDYKFYTFNGHIKYIACTYNRKFVNNKSYFDVVWMNESWEPIKQKMLKKNYKLKKNFKIPTDYININNIIKNVSKKLGRHCRIDVYIINNKIYLGEFTFFPGALLHTKYANNQLLKYWYKYPDIKPDLNNELLKLTPQNYNCHLFPYVMYK
jgi:hypothetical protein